MTMTTDTTLAARWLPMIDGWEAVDSADPNSGLCWWQDGRFANLAPDLAEEPDDSGRRLVFRDGSALEFQGGRWTETTA